METSMKCYERTSTGKLAIGLIVAGIVILILVSVMIVICIKRKSRKQEVRIDSGLPISGP